MNEQYMSDSPRPDAAARLLQASDVVSDRVRQAINTRTQAVIDAWMAVAVLAYTLAIALSNFGGADGEGLIPGVVHTAGDGISIGFLVLPAYFTASILSEGLTQSLHLASQRGAKRRRFGSVTANLLPFAAVVYLMFFAPTTPVPMALTILIVAAVPVVVLAIRSALTARSAGVRRPEPALSGLLDPLGRVSTVALGLSLGAIGLLTGTSGSAGSSVGFPGLAGVIASTAFLFLVLLTRTTRVGLDRLAEDWGRTQWSAFGCSYLLMLALSVLLTRTPWDLGIVGVIGGILIAAPLVVAAFRPAPIWAAR